MSLTWEDFMNRLLTAKELAPELRVTADTVRRWYREGRIPAYRASGRPILFDRREVFAALAIRGRVPSEENS